MTSEQRQLHQADDAQTELIYADWLDERGQDGGLYRLAGHLRLAIEDLASRPVRRSGNSNQRTVHRCISSEPEVEVCLTHAPAMLMVRCFLNAADRPCYRLARPTGMYRENLTRQRYLRDRCRHLARAIRTHMPDLASITYLPVVADGLFHS